MPNTAISLLYYVICRSVMCLGGGGSDIKAMLLVTGVFAASVVAASAAAADTADLLPHDDVDGDAGRTVDRRADGYAMAWRKGKRFYDFGAADGPALYKGRYAYPLPRERTR